MKIEKQLADLGLTPLEESVINRITADTWFELVRELIPAGQPAAENPLDPDLPSGREEGIAKVVAAKLEAMGLSVQLAAKQEGRPNVIGLLQGTTSGKTLIVNDHLDTYPAGDPTKWTMTGGNPYDHIFGFRAPRDECPETYPILPFVKRKHRFVSQMKASASNRCKFYKSNETYFPKKQQHTLRP